MERLTAKLGDKVVLPIIPMEIKNQSDLERFHKVRKKYEENTIKLAEYEDIGLSPEEVKQFKDADEQGLLLRLPCKVGDTVYRINEGAKKPIIKMRVLQVYFKQLHKDRTIIRIDAINDDDMGESCYLLEDFGIKVFLTQSEAEQKLKDM